MATIFVILGLGLLAYIRLAPFHTTRWHVDPFTTMAPKDGGVLEVFPSTLSPQDTYEALTSVALSTDRTRVLVQTPNDHHISFITRSLVFGFPDVTTVSVRAGEAGTEVAILARLRFGKSDMGVNAKRVAAWRAAAGL
jgi:uncharacterized protein (DUF1499 family)